jgi:hypothetical protein
MVARLEHVLRNGKRVLQTLPQSRDVGHLPVQATLRQVAYQR